MTYTARDWSRLSPGYSEPFVTHMTELEANVAAAIAVNTSAIGNVKDYGATGDGTTDDTAAINTALTARAGSSLFFPAGIYKTSGGHDVATATTILGAGRGTIGAGNGIAVLSLANGANADLLTISGKAVSVCGLGLYGNKAGQSGTSRGIVFNSASSLAYVTLDDLWIDSFLTSGIRVATSGTSVSESVINRCEVRNNGGRGIDVLTGANDLTVTNSQVALNGLSGIYMSGSGKLIGCHSWGNGTLNTNNDYSGATLQNAVQITGGQYETNGSSGGAGRGIDVRARGSSIVGADVYLNQGHGIYAFLAAGFSMGLVIASNRVYNNAKSGGAASGIAIDTLSGAAVTGNCCFDNQGTKTQRYGVIELSNPNYITYFGNICRAGEHVTGSFSLGTGANNVPLAANIATTNVV